MTKRIMNVGAPAGLLRRFIGWGITLCMMLALAGCGTDDEPQAPEPEDPSKPYVRDETGLVLTIHIPAEGINETYPIEKLTTLCDHSAPLSLKEAEVMPLVYGGTDSKGKDTFHGSVNSYFDPTETIPWGNIEVDPKALTYSMKFEPNNDGQRRWGKIKIHLANPAFLPDVPTGNKPPGNKNSYEFNVIVLIRQDYLR